MQQNAGGKGDEAVSCFKKALVFYESSGDDVSSGKCYTEIASVLCEQYKIDESLAFARKAQGMPKYDEDDHLYNSINYIVFGRCLESKCFLDEALMNYNNAKSIRKNILGEHHELTLDMKGIIYSVQQKIKFQEEKKRRKNAATSEKKKKNTLLVY